MADRGDVTFDPDSRMVPIAEHLMHEESGPESAHLDPPHQSMCTRFVFGLPGGSALPGAASQTLW